jgi:hypothetical protein
MLAAANNWQPDCCVTAASAASRQWNNQTFPTIM